MMAGLEGFVREWGYLAVFLGACVEGETIIMLACYAAWQGHLSWTGIISLAFVATLCADQALFQVGQRFGPRALKRWPWLAEKSVRVFALLHRFGTWFVLGFRFVYGIRTTSPVILGASGFPLRRFAILNLVAAVIWTAVSFSVGYAVARGADALMDKVQNAQAWFTRGLGILVGAWVVWRLVALVRRMMTPGSL